jgi:protein-disulfide isomerase
MMTKNKSNKKDSRMARKKQAQQMQMLRIGGFVLLAVIALVFIGFYRRSGTVSADDITEIAAANIQGGVDAPVKIVEFGDFGCPSCRAWHNSGIKEQLQQDFGDQISFTFRHFPVITRQSPQAAVASQCAAEQDAFWEYHDFLYEQAEGLGVEQLKSYAAALGLNMAVFNDCFDSGKTNEYVQRDLRSARSEGASGTPTFFVNGQLLAYPSYELMVAAIREELN